MMGQPQQQPPAPAAPSSPWTVTKNEIESYERVFSQFRDPQGDTVPDSSVQNIMIKANLQQNDAAKIWDFANPTSSNQFNKQMFFTVMKLVSELKKSPQASLPD
mmetsp:Transcript_41290/g.62871  ORF Transcript_41290/g.62871 Transcript_41290/m.62871 type:complete len:104 (-) Transcript_41290:955-1266(-)